MSVKKINKYTEKDLQDAVEAVLSGKSSYRKAQLDFNVPSTVIHSRIGGKKYDTKILQPGRKTVLPFNVEKEIKLCLQARGKIGYPCTKIELLHLVKNYVITNNIENPFKNNMPGDDWYHAFMARQSEISLKRAQSLHQLRKDARKPEVIYDFYDRLRALIDNEEEPVDTRLIFNCDESPFNLSATKTKAIGTKGEDLHRISGSAGRDNVSVLACVRNTGEALPPLVIFKGKNIDSSWIPKPDDYDPETTFAATTHGWMEEEVFYRWFTCQFVRKVNELRENLTSESWAVLVFDGHASHVSFRIIEEAKQNKIHLIRLPAHLTDCLQPLDKTVFSTVKREWDRQLVDYGRERIGKGSLTMTKAKFVERLCQTFKIALTKENIKSGFESCGIYPVDEKKFSKDLFDPNDLKKYLQKKTSTEAPKGYLIKSPGVHRVAMTNNSTPIPSTSKLSDNDDSPLPLDLSRKKNKTDERRERLHENAFEVQSITNLFCQTLQSNNSETETTESTAKKSRIRVNSRYGEVLTMTEVMERTKMVENQRLMKQQEIENRRENRKLKAAAKMKPKKLNFDEESNSEDDFDNIPIAIPKTKIKIKKKRKHLSEIVNENEDVIIMNETSASVPGPSSIIVPSPTSKRRRRNNVNISNEDYVYY